MLRDRTHFAEKISASTSEFEADYAELHDLLKRVEAEGLFRKEAIADLPTLARSGAFDADFIDNGLFAIPWLRPESLLFDVFVLAPQFIDVLLHLIDPLLSLVDHMLQLVDATSFLFEHVYSRSEDIFEELAFLEDFLPSLFD